MEQAYTAAMPAVGTEALDFRLPAAQGGEIGPRDYRGRHTLVLWFSLGLFCPFCRRFMTQLRQAYPRIREAGAEVLQVSHNTLEEAQTYLGHYPGAFAFPYLCDPDRAVHARYGVPLVPSTVTGKLRGTAAMATDFVLRGERTPSPLPVMKRYPGNDSAQAAVVLDRAGVIRAVYCAGPLGGLPGPDDLIGVLRTLA